MPELPEVETVVRSVSPYITGQRILAATLLSHRVTRGDHALTAAALAGKTVEAVGRQGKQIRVQLNAGLLYVHLGMTGKLLWNAQPGKYTRAFLTFENGLLLYDDTRMFGRVEYFTSAPELISRVGPDALTVSFSNFYERLQRFRGPIKPVLLNQTFISGVGNIYADEALFASAIHPKTPARRLSRQRAERLHQHLLAILHVAIEFRGSSISDYVDSDGARGSFQTLHNVYGRESEACPKCAGPIRRIVLGQRGTHYCPRCQRV